MGLERSDISSPVLGAVIGALVFLFFFPPGSLAILISILGGTLSGLAGAGVLECLAGAVFAPKLAYKAMYFSGMVFLIAAAYFMVTRYSPRLNPQFIYTLF